MVTKYVPQAGPITSADGWLQVIDRNGIVTGLPQFLKLDTLADEEVKRNFPRATSDSLKTREYFRILEGERDGLLCSVKRSPDGSSLLLTGFSPKPPATVKLKTKSQQLYINGRGPYDAFTGGFKDSIGRFRPDSTPLAAGNYVLEIPVSLHVRDNRPQYANWSVFYKTWFRIGHVEGRFLHFGMVSHGCATVRAFKLDRHNSRQPNGFEDLVVTNLIRQDVELGWPLPANHKATVVSWTDIYKVLIQSRLDKQSVGRIIVTDD